MMPWLTLLLHAALVAVMAPTLDGLLRQVQARIGNQAPPPWQQPWRDLVRLWRKPGLTPVGGWFVFAAAPPVALGAAATAALLVPAFTAAMGTAGAADLIVVAALLTLSRMAPAIAAFDVGALASHTAMRTATARLPAEPILLLAALAAALISGTTTLGTTPLRDGLAAFLPGALAGLALLAWAAQESPASIIFSGRDLALITAAAQLRRIAALSMAASVGLPFGMAPVAASPDAWSGNLWLTGAWFVGACCWALKLAVLGVVAGTVGQHRLVLPAAALLALIAAVIIGVQGRA